MEKFSTAKKRISNFAKLGLFSILEFSTNLKQWYYFYSNDMKIKYMLKSKVDKRVICRAIY